MVASRVRPRRGEGLLAGLYRDGRLMARRDKGKAKRTAAPTANDIAALPKAPEKRDARTRTQRRGRLEAELATARTRIAELEAQRDEALERIDRVIGTLDGLLAEV